MVNPRLEEAAVIDVAELPGEVQERLAAARSAGLPVLFKNRGRFVAVLRFISEEENAEVTSAVLTEFARSIAARRRVSSE